MLGKNSGQHIVINCFPILLYFTFWRQVHMHIDTHICMHTHTTKTNMFKTVVNNGLFKYRWVSWLCLKRNMVLLAKAFNLDIFNFNTCGRKLKTEEHAAKTTVFISLFGKEGCKDPVQCFSLFCAWPDPQKKERPCRKWEIPWGSRNTVREQKENGSGNKTK